MQNVLFHKEEKVEKWYHIQKCKYYIVTAENIARVCEYLDRFDTLSFDTETTGFDVFKRVVVGFSICPKPGVAFYFPLNNYEKDKNLSVLSMHEFVWPLLTTKKIVGHNLKFDYKFMLHKYGIRVNMHYDTFVIAKLVDCFDSAGLKNLASSLFEIDAVELDSILEEYNCTYAMIGQLKAEEIYEYCCQDADLSLRLLGELPNWGWEDTDLFRTEMDLIPILVEIELKGIKINYEYLCEAEREILDKLNAIEEKIHKLLGRKINIQSTKQFQDAFLSAYPAASSMLQRSEKSGVMCLSKAHVRRYIIKFSELLKKMGIDDENVFELYADRKVTYSLLTKYIAPWKEKIYAEKTDTIYTTLSSLRARTGRMSSEKPNLQQVTAVMRNAFVPRPGHYFVEVDFDQVEYRILAALAKLDHLVEKMNAGDFDVHKLAASMLFQIPLEEVTAEKRKKAKTLNFGVLYGMGITKLSESLGCSLEEATDLKDRYDKHFLGGTTWFEDVVRFARNKGYVLTSYGRKRRLDNIQIQMDRFSDDYKEQKKLFSAACREACNTPIQGTSADITKMTLVKLDRYLKDNEIPASILLVVHDSFLFEVSDTIDPSIFIEKMKKCIEFKFKGKVNLTVGAKLSTKSWGDLHE